VVIRFVAMEIIPGRMVAREKLPAKAKIQQKEERAGIVTRQAPDPTPVRKDSFPAKNSTARKSFLSREHPVCWKHSSVNWP
jgi:hypothetical protein